MDTYPDDADGDSLRRVQDSGSDMSQPMEVDFHIAVPNEQAGQDVAHAAKRLGYETSIFESEECSLPWTCECTRAIIATYPNVICAEAELLLIAEPFGVFPDGWGTFGNVDEDSN